MVSNWKVLFGYKSTDTYKNVYGRAYTQMKMAQSFNKSAIPKIQKALAEAKVYFNAKTTIQKRSPVSHASAKISGKTASAFLRRARA
jgi:hypothetical protein